MTALELARWCLQAVAEHPEGLSAGALMPVVIERDGAYVHLAACDLLPGRSFTYTLPEQSRTVLVGRQVLHESHGIRAVMRATGPRALTLTPSDSEWLVRTREDVP
jgi:hypothetical protein